MHETSDLFLLRVNYPLKVPEELHRNAPDVHIHGPENTGSALMRLVVERLGLKDLGESDVLDIGCGVRFAQAIINRDIAIRSYTGVDVHLPLIEYLQREIDDPRFLFAHWDVKNARYNLAGERLMPESSLPVEGSFDIIWLFSVFTHLDPSDANAMLAILRRHARPCGALFFSAFLDEKVDEFEERIPEDPLSLPCYSESYLRRLIEKNGWKICSVHPPEYCIQHYFVCRAS